MELILPMISGHDSIGSCFYEKEGVARILGVRVAAGPGSAFLALFAVPARDWHRYRKRPFHYPENSSPRCRPPPPPPLPLSPLSSLNPFNYLIGGQNPAPQTLSVNSLGGSVAIDATASSDGWLSVNGGGTATPASITVSADPSKHQPGTYTGSITVTSPTASQIIPAILNVFAAQTVAAVPLVLTTVAGRSWFVSPEGMQCVNLPLSTGLYGFAAVDQDSGDGGTALFASLGYPRCVAIDSSKNLLVCDTDYNVVRRITPAGIISTIAGINGNAGYRGDSGNATLSWLNQPVALASDSQGQVYIAGQQRRPSRQIRRYHRNVRRQRQPGHRDRWRARHFGQFWVRPGCRGRFRQQRLHQRRRSIPHPHG